MSDASPRPERPAYLLFVLVLSVLAVAALFVERAIVTSAETRRLFVWFDWAVCAVFFGDFLYTLARAEDRRRYLLTWGWLDLLSSIPSVEPLRLARSARIARILRLLRALRAARMLVRALSLRRPGNSAVTAALLGVMCLLLASVAILQVERDPASNILTAEDALWWALSTMTTVGYGDRFPVTLEGRVVGAALMLVGVGLFGVMTAFVASLFVHAEETEIERDVKALRREVGELRALLETRGTLRIDAPDEP
jgi:voltage-gated potassium channel